MCTKLQRKSGIGSVVVAVVCTLVMVCPAFSRIIYVDDDAPPGGDGSSWDQAYRFLQDGLGSAGAGDEIRVAQGVYKPDRSAAKPEGTLDPFRNFQLRQPDLKLLGGWAGLALPDPNARDVRTYQTVLSADLLDDDVIPPKDLARLYDDKANPSRKDNTSVLIWIPWVADRVVLDGCTVVGARYGGCYAEGTGVVVKDCSFRYNASGVGDAVGAGGLSFSWRGGRATGCSFYRNVSSMAGGGVQGGSVLVDCEFIENYASTYWEGGAAYLWTEARVERCTFVGNRAGLGGALSLSGAVSLRDCEFRENSASSRGIGVKL